jgi:uncharacterized integral membrane protein
VSDRSSEVPPTSPDAQPPKEEPPRTDPSRRSSSLVRTRTSATWVGLVLAILVVIATLIFILQNNQDVRIEWLGLHVKLSLAIALLIAAVGGALVPILAGGARIIQLRVARRRAKKEQPPS